MPPQHDAFGRPTEPSRDPTGRTTSSAAFAAEPAKPRPRPGPPKPRDPHRPPWRLPYLLVLLAVGVTAIGLTLSAAADWANDQPETHAFALERDPFGPRSLLRAENARRATELALAEAADGERVSGLQARPQRLMATLVDRRDRSRWITVDTAFDVSSRDLGSGGTSSTVSVAAARSADPAAALRALRRHWRTHQPDATDPTISMTITNPVFTDAPARVGGWSLSIDEVAQDHRHRRVTVDGKAIR